RFTIQRVMLAVVVAAVFLAGAELVRREQAPKPPLPWPWIPDGSPVRASGSIVVNYVNGDDVRAGVRFPRTKRVYLDPYLKSQTIEETHPGNESDHSVSSVFCSKRWSRDGSRRLSPPSPW